ncbi:MAG: hypothetical protein ACOVNU_11685 [Candidatus Kapaibacteriota bacterium]
MKQLIIHFLEKYCTLLNKSDDTDEYFFLMIENHDYILFEDKEWYVPQENSLWNKDEILLSKFIADFYDASNYFEPCEKPYRKNFYEYNTQTICPPNLVQTPINFSEVITNFLEKYCTLSKPDDTDDYAELMYNKHFLISFEDKLWYVPYNMPKEINIDEDELLIREFIELYCDYF